MNQEPFFTLGMPVYNAQNYIKRSVMSALLQDFMDFELICINDASTDESAQMLLQFAKDDTRVKVFMNDKNQGIAKTRKVIAQKAKGKFFVWVDADDELLPGALRRLYDFFSDEANAEKIVIQNAEIFRNGKGAPLYTFQDFKCSGKWMQERMLVYNGFGSYPWTIVGKTSAIQAVTYPENPKLYIDDQLVSYRYLDNASEVFFDHRLNYRHYLYEATDSHSEKFYERLSRTYSFLAESLQENWNETGIALGMMQHLNSGFFFAKRYPISEDKCAIKCGFKDSVKKLRNTACMNGLKKLGRKQRIQIVWMYCAPRLFFEYYSRRRFL